MSSDRARELRQQGIAAAKAGSKDEARRLLQESIRLEPASEPAWLWLASVARDARERMFCLQKVLEINPNNEAAKTALAANPPAPSAPGPTIATPPPPAPGGVRRIAPPPVGDAPAPRPAAPTGDYRAVERPAASPPPPTTSGPRRLNTQELLNQPPGVPLPAPDSVAGAQKQVELILREYLTPSPPPAVKWVKKTKRRAGEGDAAVLRLYTAGAAVGVLALLLVIGGIIVFSNDDLRAIVIAPTRTPTNTPTATPTSTPGVTPTPSPQPRRSATPTPQPPFNLTPANPFSLPPATAIYPPVFERPLQEAISLINQGQFAVALPTIDAERALTTQRFNPNPYYFEAIALLGQGEYNDALDILEDAEGRLDEAPNDNFAPLIDSGYAQVYLARALDAQARGDTADAADDLALAQERAEAAIARDPRLDEPYLVLARVFTLDRQFSDAISTLDEALERDDLAQNTQLLVAKGEVYYAQREYGLARQQAFLALYVDPFTEPAYQLRIRAALALEQPGLAVADAQTYLFYFPGSVTAYRLLGEARAAEGNLDLALAAYNQALTGDTDTPETAAVLVARAELLAGQGRFADALDDYSRAYAITDDLAIRAARLIAAYTAGRFSTVEEDADALIGRDVLPDAVIAFYQARAAIDQAVRDGETAPAPYIAALNTLTPLLSDPTLPDELLPTAQEYAARAQLAAGNAGAALNLIESAIAAQATASRLYLRGQIYEEQGDSDAAIRDYEWVLTWAQTVPVAFQPDVEDRLTALLDG